MGYTTAICPFINDKLQVYTQVEFDHTIKCNRNGVDLTGYVQLEKGNSMEYIHMYNLSYVCNVQMISMTFQVHNSMQSCRSTNKMAVTHACKGIYQTVGTLQKKHKKVAIGTTQMSVLPCS